MIKLKVTIPFFRKNSKPTIFPKNVRTLKVIFSETASEFITINLFSRTNKNKLVRYLTPGNAEQNIIDISDYGSFTIERPSIDFALVSVLVIIE